MNILLIDTVHPLFVEMLSAKGFSFTDATEWPKEKVFEALPNYEGVSIRSRIKVNKVFIDCATKLRFIARAGAGMESIDVVYAESKGIACISSPEGNRTAVGEHALGMILCLFNNLHRANAEIRHGKWLRETNRGIELSGKTIGIIGYGNMGQAFAKVLKGFDVTILAYDKYKKGFDNEYVKESTLNEIFNSADVVSLHTPLTDETLYMVNMSFINAFKKSFYLINTARGKVVNTADLAESIKQGKVLGACLDVLEYESASFETFESTKLPEPYKYLLESKNVLLSPHIAGWTHESKIKLATVLVEKILKLYSIQ